MTSSWIPSLQQLEEGQVGNLLQMLNLRRLTGNTFFRAYAVACVWVLFLLTVRPPGAVVIPSATVTIVPSESFVHIVSKPVPNADVRRKTHQLFQTAETTEDCLAAVHLGVPVRMMRVGTETLVNPSLVRQGSTISKAYETSAFYPERPSKLVHRFIPVTLRYEDDDGRPQEKTFEGGDAHCVLHMLAQFEGRSIYDE